MSMHSSNICFVILITRVLNSYLYFIISQESVLKKTVMYQRLFNVNFLNISSTI